LVARSPSRADLAELVVVAQAEPLGIEYAQALHPDRSGAAAGTQARPAGARALMGLAEYEL
jgi:hypothetical protein